jgi:hypothetical protein
MTSQSTLLGAAGEYYVMCQLLRRGLIAALAPVGVPNADIIVSDEIGDRVCAIQVKTRRDIGSDGGWHMKQKHEDIKSPLLFYCFVDFGKTQEDQPKSWLIPSKIVADVLKKSHQTWLNMPGKKGQKRNDGNMRRFKPDYSNLNLKNYSFGWLDQYSESWDVLRASSDR